MVVQKVDAYRIKVKGKRQNTYIAPLAATTAEQHCCVTDRAGVQPIGRRLSPSPQTLTYDHTRPWSAV